MIFCARRDGFAVSEEDLWRAMAVFRRQTEADFFINKDARGFLRERFDLWMFDYMYGGDSDFSPRRVGQLSANPL